MPREWGRGEERSQNCRHIVQFHCHSAISSWCKGYQSLRAFCNRPDFPCNPEANGLYSEEHMKGRFSIFSHFLRENSDETKQLHAGYRDETENFTPDVCSHIWMAHTEEQKAWGLHCGEKHLLMQSSTTRPSNGAWVSWVCLLPHWGHWKKIKTQACCVPTLVIWI